MAPEEIGKVIALAGVQPGARVLDMPCGIGRHSLEFARRGFVVTGVDRTQAYLEQCRAGADAEGLSESVEWVQGDMREFVRPEAFDLCVNLYTSFGYFEDQEDDRRVAANLLASLKPGGVAVFEMVAKEVLARTFKATEWHQEPDGTIVLEERTLSRDWTWIENRWVLIKGGEQRELRFSHRLYGGAELRELMEGVGFVDVRVYGSLGGIPFDQKAERLVVVGSRQKD
jgi:SAM-dependent methyltransferase